MPQLVDQLLAELDREAVATRKVLERVPGDKLDWRPHPKSMSLGQLATHLATLPGGIVKALLVDSLELPANFPPSPVLPAADLIPELEKGLRTVKDVAGEFDDEKMAAIWKLRLGGKDAFAAPRISVMRSFLMNHWYHHRGQLTVYLRLLDVPVPSIYGPSADENPFAQP